MLWYNKNSKTQLQPKLYELQTEPEVQFVPGQKPQGFSPIQVMTHL